VSARWRGHRPAAGAGHGARLPPRNTTTPVVLMGYANPIERYDQKHGAGPSCATPPPAGVDGVLVVDYPPEECEASPPAARPPAWT
jgi:tryptophan synthase alpha chain